MSHGLNTEPTVRVLVPCSIRGLPCRPWLKGLSARYLSAMRTIAVLAAVSLVACSPSREPETQAADSTVSAISAIPTLPKVAPVETDSGPPVRLVLTDTVRRLVMDPKPGDQISALQPPMLQTTDGRHLEFRGSAVTKDSAYFVGDVVLELEEGALPLDGALTTSYCRAGEKLCRTAKRMVRFTR